ncbi:MAG: DUF1553 domain-containing protein, partial [Pirellulaceae bacterium]|nr:DUF1553 domain-containing protein [Pirellulaceae bacterium]
TMSSFVSLTVNCARCHAHKFDPISQEDYFALQAVFAGVVKGDVAYDIQPAVARQRKQWQRLLAAARARDSQIVLADTWRPTVDQWESSAAADALLWSVAQPVEYSATDHSATDHSATNNGQLKRLDDGSLLLLPPYPEQTVTRIRLKKPESLRGPITALRIDVLRDDSLPKQGPGAAVNGNLHLSEVDVQWIARSPTATRPIATFKPVRATADFEQEGWLAQHAIDGNMKTAWGIHPQESRDHTLVVHFAIPPSSLPQPGGDSVANTVADSVADAVDSDLQVTLHQSHGRQHVIGRLRLSLTDQADPRIVPLAEEVAAALRVPKSERDQSQRVLIAAEALRSHASAQLDQLPAHMHVYAAARQVPAGNGAGALAREQPHLIHLLKRGNIDQPERIISPAALAAVPNLPSAFDMPEDAPESARRAALADWLADARNGLTWRSQANRLWHYHFGRGLCDTPSDFGRMGGQVTHLALLDWLASQLRDDDDHSLKRLHRLIVSSATYQQSSTQTESDRPEVYLKNASLDRDNVWLWRQHRRRLDADAYRDAVLSASGTLDHQMGGPSIQQFTTSPGQQLTPALDYTKFDWESPPAARRSIYRFVWRGIADPFMESLDFPDLGLLSPTRSQSVSALQALTLYNNDFVLVHARRLADRAQREAGPAGTAGTPSNIGRCISILCEHAWQRAPTGEDLVILEPLAREHGLEVVGRVVLNSNEFMFVD